MLKLEKIGTGRNVHLRISQRRLLGKSYFWRALAFAAALHLAALALFRIQGFTLRSDKWLNSPVEVNVDMTRNDQQAVAKIDEGRTERYNLAAPRKSIPHIPTMPIPLLEKDISYNKESEIQSSYPFKQFEEQINPLTIMNLGLLPEKNNLEVEVNGLLEGRKVISYVEEDVENFVKQDGEFFVRFDVEVDDKSGKILWHDIAKSSGNIEVDKKFETVLKKMRFQTLPNSFITKGEVSMLFHSGGNREK